MLEGRLPSKVRCGASQARRALGLDLLRRLAEGQRLGLGKDVGQEQVVVPPQRVERLEERDEVAGDELRALVDQLVEGMLAVGARLAPVDRPGLIGDLGPIQRDALAVALHRQLLQVGREALQVLLVGQDRHGLAPKKLLYQTPSSPISTGKLRSKGAVRKCSSICMETVEHGRKFSGPTAIIVDSPIAESIE